MRVRSPVEMGDGREDIVIGEGMETLKVRDDVDKGSTGTAGNAVVTVNMLSSGMGQGGVELIEALAVRHTVIGATTATGRSVGNIAPEMARDSSGLNGDAEVSRT